MSSPCFPLAPLDDFLLFSIFSKMSAQSFCRCRQSTQWLHKFVDKNRAYIKTFFPIKMIIFSKKGSHFELKGEKLPRSVHDLSSIRPHLICISKVSSKAIPLICEKIKRFRWFCARIEAERLGEKAMQLLLDGLYSAGIPPALRILPKEFYPYEDSLATHPILKKIDNIYLGPSCKDPDLSFLLEPHSEVIFSAKRLSDRASLINAIELICSGNLPTKSILIATDYDRKTIEDLLAAFSWELLWSREFHQDNLKMCLTAESYMSWLRFHKIPVSDGKVGVLCTSEFGDQLKFKVLDKLEEFYDKVHLGMLF